MIFDLAEMDRLLSGATLHVDSVHVSRGAEKLSAEDYCWRVADRAGSTHRGHGFPFCTVHPERLFECFEAGATIRIPDVGRYSRAAREQAEARERREKATVTIDAVLAPAGATARPLECIERDLEVLPLEGSAFVTIGERTFRAIAGESLLAPAGSMVEVVSIDPFLMLEIAVQRERMIDLLRAAAYELCADMLTSHAGSRHAVSLQPKSDFLGSNDRIAETASAFERGAPRERAKKRIALDRTKQVRARSLAMIRRETSIGSRVSIADPFFVLADEGTELKLSFSGKRLSFPPRARVALAWLCGEKTAEVASLPGLEDDERLVLAGRLVREGFLVIDE